MKQGLVLSITSIQLKVRVAVHENISDFKGGSLRVSKFIKRSGLSVWTRTVAQRLPGDQQFKMKFRRFVTKISQRNVNHIINMDEVPELNIK